MSTAIFVGEQLPASTVARISGRSQFRQIVRRFGSDRFAIAGLGLIALLALAALSAPIVSSITGHGPNQLFPDQLNQALDLPTGPSAHFLFGVDQEGRDVFVRCLYGLRTSLMVSLLATAIATTIGVSVGMAAGYLGGWLDTLVSRFADVFLALPVVLFAISVSSVCSITTKGCLGGTIQPGVGLVVFILALFTWPYIARIVRGQTLALRDREFVRAARGLGASRLQVMFVEILPNLTAQIIVYVTLIIPSNILFEAALSFLGVGIPQTTPSLGQMIADATAGSLFTYAWWMMAFPGALLLLVTLAFNVVGDGLRDAMGVEAGMWRYVIRRAGWAVVTLLVVTAICFVIYFVLPPVSPAVLFAGKEATPAQIAVVEQNLGLNHPVWQQYLLFLYHLVFGDRYGWPGLGFSYVNHSSVRSLIAGRIVITSTLAIGAAIVWLAIGIPVGVVSALKRRTMWDRLALGVTLFFVSAPVFWLGLVFLWLFWYKLGIAPGTGYDAPSQYGLWAWFSHMIMPWIVLALLYAAWYARMVRGSVLDTLAQDFVLTAHAKGLSRARVLVRHVLRAAITPTLTMLGMDIAGLVSGSVIIEVVFNLNGVGQWAISAVSSDDIPSVLAVTMLGAVLVIAANLVVDVLYAYLDPRIHYG